MKELKNKFKEIKKELAALGNKKSLTGTDLIRVEKLFDEVMDQINKIRKEELGTGSCKMTSSNFNQFYPREGCWGSTFSADRAYPGGKFMII